MFVGLGNVYENYIFIFLHNVWVIIFSFIATLFISINITSIYILTLDANSYIQDVGVKILKCMIKCISRGKRKCINTIYTFVKKIFIVILNNICM